MASLGVLEQLQPVLKIAINAEMFARDEAFKCMCFDTKTNEYNSIAGHMKSMHNVTEFTICMCGLGCRPQDYASHATTCESVAKFRSL
jgi:hypothetical protein